MRLFALRGATTVSRNNSEDILEATSELMRAIMERNELGPEFDELRAPLEDLRGLRGFNPRSAITRHLFDDLGDDPSGDLIKSDGLKPNGYAAPTGSGTPVSRPLQPGERAPFDPDAT